tara:strand:- start:2725 stop:2973 length:249 start_codon:yes stop_codon:yes gene_type:complete
MTNTFLSPDEMEQRAQYEEAEPEPAEWEAEQECPYCGKLAILVDLGWTDCCEACVDELEEGAGLSDREDTMLQRAEAGYPDA